MIRRVAPLLLWLALGGAGALPRWSPAQVAQLQSWLAAMPGDALPGLSDAGPVLAGIVASGDAQAIDAAATGTAVRVLEAEYNGCCHAALRKGWLMPPPTRPDAAIAVADAIAGDSLPALFAAARPSHPLYTGLRAAYATEADPARRATIAANMDRWRWMPRDLGARYLLVNAAAFEATLWDSAAPAGRWIVVVGKTRTPTPVFAATVTGVNFNPWWEIPASIVRESVGAMLRKRPAVAAQRGYVLDNGRYRQKPGPANSLGRMKLVMPNPHAIFLHDTPSQGLFAAKVRAYSHGCVRVGDALGLASTLIEQDRTAVDDMVATRETQTVPLPQPIPVYITYFTAEAAPGAPLRLFPDVYRRDAAPAGAPPEDPRCAA